MPKFEDEEDVWFAVAGQEFGVVGGKAVAFSPTAATVFNEGGPYGRPRDVDGDLVRWMKMKRAMLRLLVERCDLWIERAGVQMLREEQEEDREASRQRDLRGLRREVAEAIHDAVAEIAKEAKGAHKEEEEEEESDEKE